MPVPWRRAPAIDPAAREYCARSGATDRRVMSDWVRGLKGLGIWESCVGWTFLPGQSAGAGSVAHSFGGLGRFDGTLISGPAWAAGGMSFGTNAYCDTALQLSFLNENYTVLIVCSFSITATNGRVIGSTLPNTPIYTQGSDPANVELRTYLGGSIPTIVNAGNLTGMNMLAAAKSGATVTGFKNASPGVVTTPTQAGSGTERFCIFGSSTGNAGIVAAAFYLATPLTLSGVVLVNGLYKSTLGKGLGLP